MAKKVQLMTNAKEWQTVNGVEVLVDVPQEDINPITDSSCVEIEGHRTLEETINQDNMFTPEIVETKVHSKVGGVYHDNVVDGAYEEAILYGNTQVNLVESVTTGSKYIPHSFTSFQGNESKIGNYHNGRTNQVAPLVKGVTMVNLCQETSLTIQYQHTRVIANHNAKPNTKYTLKCKFTEKNKNAGIMIQSYGYKDGTWGYIEISKTIQNLGDDVLLTFTTHEQADSIIIYNNPAFCEDENDSITLEDIMVIEGDVTDLNLPFFKGMRSVELSKPLTNLLHDGIYKTYGSTTQLNHSNGNVTVTGNAIGAWQSANFHFINEDELKPNTKYIVMWDSLTQTQTSTSSVSIIAVYDTKSGDGNINIGTPNNKSECPVLRSIVFDTTGRDASGIVLRIHATLSNSETGTTTVTGLRVFEWDDSLRTLDLQTIGYFSGTKYVSARALETEGKNLYPYGDINFTPTSTGWFDAKGTNYMYGDIAQKSKCRFLLKKGTYKLSSDYNNRTNLEYMVLVTDKEETMKDTTFTLEEDTYLTLRLQPVEANVPTTLTNIQIERGETATSYEAYQGRYYKPRETEEIILRSLPNGICDTFNLQTGELVQNVTQATLGQNNYNIIIDATLTNTIRFRQIGNREGLTNVTCICDKMISTSNYNADYEHIYINKTDIWCFINKSKLSAETVDGIKQYLSQNPITVQYELKEPIITKLQTYDRVYSGQTNALANMGNNLSALTYYSNNYHLKVGNLSPVPAISEPITSIPYDVRLKPSTLYTVKYNRGGNSNSMKFDLGGSIIEKTNATDLGIVPEEFTVRTPAILSHEQLILSGTGYAHNFIVVEGDITGTELPYFEGMKDVKMPIVKNIGRNLLNESSMRVFYESGVTLRTYDVFACKPNTRYCFVSVGGEDNCNWHVCNKDAHYERPENESVGITQYLGYSREIVTPQDCYYMCIHTGSSPTTDREVYDIKTAIYEGSFAECVNYGYEDYKENSVYAVQGEYPITSEMIEQGGFSTGNGTFIEYEEMKYDSSLRLRSKGLIPVKPNTTYAFAHSFPKFGYNIYQWNGNREFLQETSQYFGSGQIETITTTADTQYIHFLMSKHNPNETITVAEYDWSQFHIYELDSTINLRSLPNGVKDELNLLTGEYIQRVGEIVLDGSEKGWNIGVSSNANLLDFYIHNIIPNALNNGDGISDKFNYVNEVWYVQVAGICVNMDKGISMMLPTKYVKTQDLQGCLEWLQQNPITVQYQLAEPIISYPRIVSNTQEREIGVKLPNGVCDTYNPSTGITVKRVGKVVLDGSEDWEVGGLSNDTYYEGWLPNSPFAKTMKPVTDISFINGNFVIMFVADGAIPHFNSLNPLIHGGMNIKNTSNPQDPGATGFVIQKSKMTTPTLDGFKQYLASNPITVWYELKYPQIQPDIVLPNGVHDEYNPETGVYTKRVGFIEFDGSTDEKWLLDTASTVPTDLTRFACVIKDKNLRPYSIGNFVVQSITSYNMVNNDTTSPRQLPNVWDYYQSGFYLEFDTTDLGMTETDDYAGKISKLRTHLAQNPIKVWYELATPITYQLTPYFGLPQPYAYEDGYLIHDSAYPETTLPPEFKYKLVANRTGQIVQNGRKLQEHTTRLSNLEALIIEATIESLFNRELQLFELELMDIQLIDLGE